MAIPAHARRAERSRRRCCCRRPAWFISAGRRTLRGRGAACRHLSGRGSRPGYSAGLRRAWGKRRARTGYLLPVPVDGADESVTQLKADLATLKGNTALVQTTQSGWGAGAQQKVPREYSVQRLGADPPEALGELRGDVAADILAACL